MNEPLIDHIQRLERSNRFWRNTSFVLAALLLSFLTIGFTSFALAQQRAQRAIQQELVARNLAEANRIQAERALQKKNE